MTKPKLRVLGTSVVLLEEIRAAAASDLGIDIEFEILSGVDCQQKGVTRPDAFDIYDQWFHSVDLLWTAGSIQPIDTRRIARWKQINELTKSGRLHPDAKLGQGARPSELLFIQEDQSLGAVKTRYISALPTAHNADSFAYDPKIRHKLNDNEPESWGWLLDGRWSGKCGQLTDPAIGAVDAALAVQAAGLMEFVDIGNMSVKEIDTLIELLIEKKKVGHFGSFWSSLEDSVQMMERKKALISGIWSPAVFALHALGKPVVSAAPKEGYRGWHSAMCLSASLSGETLETAYAYLNWWLSGKAGAIVARQGFYMSVPETTREHLSKDEWAFWYEGKPARTDLRDSHGKIIIAEGTSRDGGSYLERLSNIAVWNTLMDEHNYLVRRWNEFLAA